MNLQNLMNNKIILFNNNKGILNNEIKNYKTINFNSKVKYLKI